MFLSAKEIQLGRGEPIKDTARVLGRMIHGAVIRTFAQKDVEEFAEFSRHSDAQRPDGRRTSLPDSDGHFHLQGEARADPGQGGDVHWGRRVQCAARRGFLRRRNWDSNCASPRRRNSSRRRGFWGARAARLSARTDMRRGGARRGFALHGRVGFHGQGGGGGGAGAGIDGLSDQRRSW